MTYDEVTPVTVTKPWRDYTAWLTLLGDCWVAQMTTDPDADCLLYMRLVRRLGGQYGVAATYAIYPLTASKRAW